MPKRYVDSCLLPKIGRQPAGDIRPADIARLHDEIKGRAPTAANEWHLPPVIDWLKRLQVLAAGSDYVFPKRRRDPRERVPHVGIDTLNVALLRVKHGLAHFTLHDLRRTARTHLAALGVRREVAERCFGHKLRGIEGTYDRHDYFKERRAALESWTALLLGIERGERKMESLSRRQMGARL